MVSGLRGGRCFAADYSTTGQQWWKSPEDPFWADDYCGLLRFDSLTSEKLVVPDTHIFDGPFFAARDPHALLDALRRNGFDSPEDLPIEIRTRGRTLGESLANLLRRTDSDGLNGFVFKTIQDEELRRRVAVQLYLTPALVLDSALERTADPAEAVASVLLQCLDRLDARERADEVVLPLWEAWTKWLELDAVPGLVVPWDDRPFRIAEALGVDPIPDRRLQTRSGQDAVQAVTFRVSDGPSYRGDVYSDLMGLRAHVTHPDDLGEIDLVEHWYSRGRYRAIAWQHDAACVQRAAPWESMTALQALWEEIAGRPESDRAEIPPDVVTTLGEMSDEHYADFVRTHRRDLSSWWRQGDPKALLRVADGLASLVPGTPSRTRRVGVFEIIGEVGVASGAIAGAKVGGLEGAAVGAVVGLVAKLSTAAVKPLTQQDRVRRRIVEVWTYRGAG